MYEGLGLADLICHLLNEQRFSPKNCEIKSIVHDSSRNIATVFWDEQAQKWDWKHGLDPEEVEQWVSEEQYSRAVDGKQWR